jgi:hypothetical protein
VTGRRRRTPAPARDEVEISIFGNGNGECIVVHVGDGHWIVIDSFFAGKEPVALAYLRQIEVPFEAIRLVVATHYHSDHIGGLSKVLAAGDNARWVTTAAICDPAFAGAVERSSPPAAPESLSGPLAEFRALRDIADGPGRPPNATWAANDRSVLWPENLPTTRAIAIRSLSPNEWVIRKTLAKIIAAATPDAVGGPPVDRNSTSMVLWMTMGDRTVLLGADQVRGGRGRTGWSAILADNVPAGRRSELYKVAHHGSKHSDRPEIWTNLLTDDVRAAITTKRASGLPRRPMLDDLSTRAGRLTVAGLKSPVEEAADALDVAFGGLEPLTTPVGHVRYRASRLGTNARWKVKANRHTAEHL